MYTRIIHSPLFRFRTCQSSGTADVVNPFRRWIFFACIIHLRPDVLNRPSATTRVSPVVAYNIYRIYYYCYRSSQVAKVDFWIPCALVRVRSG